MTTNDIDSSSSSSNNNNRKENKQRRIHARKRAGEHKGTRPRDQVESRAVARTLEVKTVNYTLQ